MQQLDLYSAIKEFNVLSSKELGSLIRDAENGIIKCTINGSSFEITVENLARHLVEHISNEVSSLTVDEQHFRNLLSGLRFLHTLCDISSHHLALARVSKFSFQIIYFLILYEKVSLHNFGTF
ncbi:putative nodulin homeobox protein [Helianthus annuus]|nr:putative nodulin homeobox protein [Helianthus annuus]KAJ0625487.1 putative nodulin homeobox protein [Helianthus annuus]KAJ0781884.1 putative nodulin homeobox protein [Helianthus annuus]